MLLVHGLSPEASQYETFYVTSHKGACRCAAFHPNGLHFLITLIIGKGILPFLPTKLPDMRDKLFHKLKYRRTECHFGHVIHLFITSNTNVTRNPAKKNCFASVHQCGIVFEELHNVSRFGLQVLNSKETRQESENMTDFLCLECHTISSARFKATRRGPGKPLALYVSFITKIQQAICQNVWVFICRQTLLLFLLPISLILVLFCWLSDRKDL